MKYKSEILETIHESAKDKFKIGAITKERMNEYDELCLETKNKLSAKPNSTRENAIEPNLVTA